MTDLRLRTLAARPLRFEAIIKRRAFVHFNLKFFPLLAPDLTTVTLLVPNVSRY
jgi:hypothetical protein